eukprot:759227-Hanusia_phi.AAC.1
MTRTVRQCLGLRLLSGAGARPPDPGLTQRDTSRLEASETVRRRHGDPIAGTLAAAAADAMIIGPPGPAG